LLTAPLIAVLLTYFVFQSYQVDGVSMENTLHNNDRLIVWKLPRTWARITHHQYVPKRGDIIIANVPDLTACGQGDISKQVVKRVIALPGEHVVYKHGTPGIYTIYNATHPDGFNPDTTLSYNQAGSVLTDDPNGTDVDVRLGSNQVFVSGDHRGDSCDSRYFGPLDTKQLIGKVAIRIFPLSGITKY
jgi:signal peptidase I